MEPVKSPVGEGHMLLSEVGGSVNGSYFSSISKRKLQAIVPLWLNLWFIETVAEPTR